MRTRSLPHPTSLTTAIATQEPKTVLAELAELEVLATSELRLRQVSQKSTVADEENALWSRATTPTAAGVSLREHLTHVKCTRVHQHVWLM